MKKENKIVVDNPLSGKQMRMIYGLSKGRETKSLVRYLTDGRAQKVSELNKKDASMVIEYLLKEESNQAEEKKAS